MQKRYTTYASLAMVLAMGSLLSPPGMAQQISPRHNRPRKRRWVGSNSKAADAPAWPEVESRQVRRARARQEAKSK